jgi:hypothetical protein
MATTQVFTRRSSVPRCVLWGALAEPRYTRRRQELFLSSKQGIDGSTARTFPLHLCTKFRSIALGSGIIESYATIRKIRGNLSI